MTLPNGDLLAGEKHVEVVEGSQVSASDGEATEADWTEEEERALVRKIDFLVMPLLMVSFFALQMDRGNM